MSDSSKKLIKMGVIGFVIFLIVLVLIVSIGSWSHEKKEEEIENGPGQYDLVVYKSDVGICFERSPKCDKSPFSIKVKTETAKIVSIETNSLYLIYSDDGKLYLFDTNSRESTLLDLEPYYDYYNVIVDNKKARGVVYGEGKISENSYYNLGYYDLSKKVKLYDNKYNSIDIVNSNYLVGKNSSYSNLLDITKEEIVIERNNKCINYDIKKYGSYSSYLLYNSCSRTYEILNTDKKSIFTDLKENSFSLDLSGNIYIIDGSNNVKVYGYAGMFMKNASFEGRFIDLVINYVVVEINNKLYLKDLNRNSESILLGDWGSTYQYQYNSDYYPENYLFSVSERRAGIYILFVKNPNSIAGSEYYVDLKTNIVNTIAVSDYRAALKKG